MKTGFSLVAALAFTAGGVLMAADADAGAAFKKLDTNADNKLSLDEFKKKEGLAADKAEAEFKKLDKNGDKSLTLAEFNPPKAE